MRTRPIPLAGDRRQLFLLPFELMLAIPVAENEGNGGPEILRSLPHLPGVGARFRIDHIRHVARGSPHNQAIASKLHVNSRQGSQAVSEPLPQTCMSHI